ncbi:LYR motif-containing protein 4 [Agrilus planipennis]|uniref:LYR motif-containing protein 4 n=1 Tax=Agrilus planipennis TaxID=224129 RepID=A0A1W4X644_AGRPL|nr:LYR motif-containing protein 4 [Agrilus planipennis]
MTKQEVLSLYKLLLQSSKKFPSYNFRNYALRRVRDSFREYKTITDQSDIAKLYNEGCRNLEIIKRQVIVGQLYQSGPLVIETLQKKNVNN